MAGSAHVCFSPAPCMNQCDNHCWGGHDEEPCASADDLVEELEARILAELVMHAPKACPCGIGGCCFEVGGGDAFEALARVAGIL